MFLELIHKLFNHEPNERHELILRDVLAVVRVGLCWFVAKNYEYKLFKDKFLMFAILQFDKFVYLPQHKILILRVQFIEQIGHPLHFFLRGAVEHTPLSGEQPVFVDGKSAGDEVDKTVFYFFMPRFNF